MTTTVWADGHRILYHWQSFNEDYLASTLANSAIRCSNPANFNDPWDCKAEFNTELLNDADENELHIRWAVDLRRRTNPGISEDEIARMETKLRSDRTFAAGLISTVDGGFEGHCSALSRVLLVPGCWQSPHVGTLRRQSQGYLLGVLTVQRCDVRGPTMRISG